MSLTLYGDGAQCQRATSSLFNSSHSLYYEHQQEVVLIKELRAVLGNRNLGLLLSGRLVSSIGDWLYVIALSIAIYRFSHGSSVLIGVLWIVKLVPNLLFRPFTGALADRLGYRRSMIIADLGRTVLVGILALALTSSTWAIIFPFVFLVTTLSGLFRPASVGLIPSMVDSREQRLAANAVTIEADSIAMIVGSALGGVVAGLGWINQLLAVDALTFAVSALALWRIRTAVAVGTGVKRVQSEPEEEQIKGMFGGFQLIARRPALVFTAGVMALPELASGAVVIWIVPYSFHSLHLGNAGIGYLYTALGIGAVVGGLVAAGLGGNVRLDGLLAASVLVMGVALVLFGWLPMAGAALAAILVVGLAETVEYAAYETLLQQSIPEEMLGAASGALDSFLFDMMLAGNLLSGILAATLGLTWSIVGLGVAIVVVTGGAWWYLQVNTARRPNAVTLARIPLFAGLASGTREWAVRRMVREQFAPGAVVVRQGDHGDKFYVVARGTVQVDVNTDGQVSSSVCGPGDIFGEIALLENIPRTATVRALDPLTVYTLSREDFQDLQSRAGELKESLLEVAASRLAHDTNIRATLASRA